MPLQVIGKRAETGLRDLALIAAMFYGFARVSAILKLKVEDYYHNGARRRLRLHEKGGKEHEMPVHHLLEQILDEYIAAAGLQSGQPLFQSVNPVGTEVTGRALNRYALAFGLEWRQSSTSLPRPQYLEIYGSERRTESDGNCYIGIATIKDVLAYGERGTKQ